MEPRRPHVDDRYEFLRLLATGGMGQVWCARDTLLQRDVAVKVLRSEFTGNPTFLARFRAEAQHTAGLVHPNIAGLYDYGELIPGPDGRGEHVAYLVMEFVDGEPLSAVLAREGPLEPGRVLPLLRQVAAGLAAAHAAGVVHRDVKPANVLVGRDGVVKITDFGIASSTSSVPLTQTGHVIGTAHYLSPEQAQGVRATPASDVYALGMVAYECLAGHRAFDGENSVAIALRQIREQPPLLPPGVPQGIRRLVERALVKDPAQRFPDGAAFRDAVDAVLAGRDPDPPTSSASTADLLVPGLLPPASATGVPAPAGGRRRRIPVRTVVGALGVLALAGITAGILTGGDHGGAARASAESATGSATSSAPAAPAIRIAASDYIGRPLAEVSGQLAALGLHVQVRTITTADLPDGQVIAVDPTGALAPGRTVTVTAAAAPVPAHTSPVPAPAPAPVGGVQVSVPGGVVVTAEEPASVAVQGTGQSGPAASPPGNGQGKGKGKGKTNGDG